MRDLYRLVYTSFRKPSCDEKAIQDILQACKRNNPGRGVTGILLHSKNRFIQYMEGEKEHVEALYNLIKDDPRHTSVNRRSLIQSMKGHFRAGKWGIKTFRIKQLHSIRMLNHLTSQSLKS